MRYFLIIAILLTQCTSTNKEKVDRTSLTFKTGDDTEIYFKNIRQSYYDLEENKAAKFNVFRYSDRSLSNEKPVINLAIVINYLNDEAYILLEPNSKLKNEDALEIKVIGKPEKTISIGSFNREAMLDFAASVYENIIAGNQLEVKVNNQFIPFLNDKNSKEAFRITMYDYYRLTRVY